MTTYIIDPQAKLTYGWDWATWLGTDTINASTWTITPTGPTLTGSTHDTTTTTVAVSGCTLGVTYTLSNHVTTTAGFEDDRSHTLLCANR